MPDLVNPYIAGNPVTGREMFFGRDDVFDFIRHTLVGKHRDNVIVLYGQRRTGKTSVLYQMRSQLDIRYLCIFMDLHGFALQRLDGFLWELTNHIIRVLRRDYQITLPRPSREEFATDPRSFFENEFLNHLWAAIGDRHLLLMLDEAIRLEEQVKAGDLEHEVFEYMRHLMQHYEQLNFLFSLGSGLEEMEQEYSFLFNVGLYKKISFLDRGATSELITQPIKDCYQVEPEAVERIYHITSGHPYYTQLLCHCLFNCWTHEHKPYISVQDVDEVLNEAVERGSAVLKHVWDESRPAEKAVLAGMAAAMAQDHQPVGTEEMKRAWTHLDVVLPRGEMVKAIGSLIAREVIVGQDQYTFTVDLQRLWVQKHARLEWVKEEITEAIHTWSSDPTLNESLLRPSVLPHPPRRFFTPLLLAVGLAVLLLISSGILYGMVIVPTNQSALRAQQATATAKMQATATAIASHYPFSGRPPALNDSLSHKSDSIPWDDFAHQTSGCQFTAGAYHVYQNDKGYYRDCYAKGNNLSNFSNFTYEAQMTILKGDCGGLLFRADQMNTKLYMFAICQDGGYALYRYEGSSHSKALRSNFGSPLKPGRKQSNLLSVVAQGQSITLYINHEPFDQVNDKTYSAGQIGFIADATDNPTEVAYNNVKVWTL